MAIKSGAASAARPMAAVEQVSTCILRRHIPCLPQRRS